MTKQMTTVVTGSLRVNSFISPDITNTNTPANSADLDETAHDEQTHQDPVCHSHID